MRVWGGEDEGKGGERWGGEGRGGEGRGGEGRGEELWSQQFVHPKVCG